jgi:isopentenyl-diphosphate delta-isomerase
MKTKIIIVDESDNIIGYKDRETVTSEDIYRVSVLWITNSQGEILLAKRALTKAHNPGQWGPAVVGTVEEGEDYLINIIKEASEEIGLKDIAPQVGQKVRVRGKYNFFGQWYTLVVDKALNEFVIDESEVAEIRWISKDNLQKEIEVDPAKFSESMQRFIKLV